MAAGFGASTRRFLWVLLALGLLASGEKSLVCATRSDDGNTMTVSVGDSSSGHKGGDEDPQLLEVLEILRQDEERVKWIQSRASAGRIDLVTNDPATSSSTSGKGTNK
ncbi:hypothetical protein MLD38_014115 [Melastoma candidum]|uniref:Uncharacterized protein n=1 Tax=Melastoma candidum TaxID=119954 RepID=A0ACB9REU9_9MYRT|nr:hypothetical protein MLD38_014115 [Melastoma candidum]